MRYFQMLYGFIEFVDMERFHTFVCFFLCFGSQDDASRCSRGAAVPRFGLQGHDHELLPVATGDLRFDLGLGVSRRLHIHDILALVQRREDGL